MDTRLSIALSTALTCPANNYHGTAIQLLLPFPLSAYDQLWQRAGFINSTALTWLTVDNRLPYCMALKAAALKPLYQPFVELFMGTHSRLKYGEPMTEHELHLSSKKLRRAQNFLPVLHIVILNKSSEKIRRADVRRLLYLPPVDDELSYNLQLFTPWTPVGNTTAS